MHWHISETARYAWVLGLWRSMRLRGQNERRGEELVVLTKKYEETTEEVAHVREAYNDFRQGRVGAYMTNNKDDMDDDKALDDDYTQLVAFTRTMSLNWTRERLMRGIASTSWVLGRSFWAHLSSIFYTWRQNTLKLKLLATKFNLFELDKLELQAERVQAVEGLEDQQDENKNLQDTIERLKKELAKLRRDKAWMERFSGQ